MKAMKEDETLTGILVFDRDEVLNVIKCSKENPFEDMDGEPYWTAPYDGKRTNKPGLWIVGDEGVYIMPNGELPNGGHPENDNPWATRGSTSHPIAYAKGCNPKVDDFDDWWQMKGRTWGGDDGAELLDAEEIEEIINNADGKHHLLVRFYHDNKNDVGIMKLSTQGTPR
jgi:hypothetical protein